MKVALANGVLGEKMMVDSVYNCLVNDQGKVDTAYQNIVVFLALHFSPIEGSDILHGLLSHINISQSKKKSEEMGG